MRIAKLALIVTILFIDILAYGQPNAKYQSQIKAAEALYKIESTEIGKTSMPGYHSMILKVILRKWTNLATNTKRYDIEFQNDVSCFIEKGDWSYTLNSLKYIQDALTNNFHLNTDYCFRTTTGIQFSTRGLDVYVDLPGDNYRDHKLSQKSLEELILALEEAISLAK